MLRSVRNAESITVTLRGGVGELERACEEVGSFLVEQGLGGCRFELGLLIREALCNCIIHGGR